MRTGDSANSGRSARRRALAALLAAVVLAPAPWAAAAAGPTAVAAADAPAAPGAVQVSATAAPAELAIGGALTVAGRVTAGGLALGSAQLQLQTESYPFHGFATVAAAASAPDGSFAFAPLRPDRNTRVRVVAQSPAAATSQVLAVTVDPTVAIHASSLGPGRTRLSVRVGHTTRFPNRPLSVWWYVAARGSRVFRLASVTPARELAAGVTYASAIVDPPSRRFAYRVCLNPAWEHAMGARATHGRCPTHDFAVPHDAR